MKRTPSGLLSFVTKLQKELGCLLEDASRYNDALKKKQAFDEALLKCTEHSAAYIQAIPRHRPDYHEVKLEAETNMSTWKRRKPNTTRNSQRMLKTAPTCKAQLARSVETHRVLQGIQQLPQEQED